MSDTTVEELVEAAKAPGKFSIVSVLKDRAYPTEDLTILLDESLAYKGSLLKEKIAELKKVSVSTDGNVELDDLVSEMQLLVNKIESDKYVFTILGISEGKREELLNQSIEAFPSEYFEEKNPFTGETKHVEKENKQRDRLFTNLLWENHIVKITAPSGDEQTDITAEDVEEFRNSLPLVAIGVITEGIEKIRNATALFMYTVDEDFLAKS